MSNSFYQEFDCATLEPFKAREAEYRTIFQINRDRIIHTSAFRRLQNKTQVFWSGEYDFYRTRLTHSIEVSQIGRSICAALQRRSDLLGGDFFIDPDLVEAACLAHDLGHPPFGHAGERTLHRLMRDHGGFEGNAQTLRLLTETIFSGQNAGMNPCRAFLDATLKYKTLHSELVDPENHFLYDAQSRYLDFVLDGRDFPLELPPGPARDSFRSVECQIMDWADDTAYSLNDIADALQAGFLRIEALEKYGEEKNLSGAAADHLTNLLKYMRKGNTEVKLRVKIGDFVDACSLVQDTNFMSGTSNRYRYRLVVAPEAKAESKLYKSLALHLVFRSQQLQQLEHKAARLLTTLWETLTERYLVSPPSHDLIILSPKDEANLAAAPDHPSKARVLCDVLSRMTDGQANRTYKRLFDPDFGSISDLV